MKTIKTYHREEFKKLRDEAYRTLESIEFNAPSDLWNYFYWAGRASALELLVNYKKDLVHATPDIDDLRYQAGINMNNTKKLFDSLRYSDKPFGKLMTASLHLQSLMAIVYVLDELRGETGEDIKQLIRERDGKLSMDSTR